MRATLALLALLLAPLAPIVDASAAGAGGVYSFTLDEYGLEVYVVPFEMWVRYDYAAGSCRLVYVVEDAAAKGRAVITPSDPGDFRALLGREPPSGDLLSIDDIDYFIGEVVARRAGELRGLGLPVYTVAGRVEAPIYGPIPTVVADVSSPGQARALAEALAPHLARLAPDAGVLVILDLPDGAEYYHHGVLRLRQLLSPDGPLAGLEPHTIGLSGLGTVSVYLASPAPNRAAVEQAAQAIAETLSCRYPVILYFNSQPGPAPIELVPGQAAEPHEAQASRQGGAPGATAPTEEAPRAQEPPGTRQQTPHREPVAWEEPTGTAAAQPQPPVALAAAAAALAAAAAAAARRLHA